ncbi:MAG: hypothetical protein ACP5VE_01050 [Chthonomonadales bacterium]
MSDDVMEWVSSVLRHMPAARPWDDAAAETYRMALRRLPDALVRRTIARAVAVCTQRPTVAELLTLAAECAAGHHPSASAAWKEVRHLLETRGLYCRRDPLRPNVFYEGTPVFSHRLIGEVVAAMGGWRALCLTEDGLERLNSSFLRLYRLHEEQDRIRQFEALCNAVGIHGVEEAMQPAADIQAA